MYKKDVVEKSTKKMKKKKVNVDTEGGDNEENNWNEVGGVSSLVEDEVVCKKEMKKKRKKEDRKAVLGVGSVCLVENDDAAYLVNYEMRDSGDKNGKDHEVIEEGGDLEKVDGKKQKKVKTKKREEKRDKSDLNAAERIFKETDGGEENGQGVEKSGVARDGKITNKAEKKKVKRQNRKTKDDLKGFEMSGQGIDGGIVKKVERKKRKRESEQIEDDWKGVELTSEDFNGKVKGKAEKKKRNRGKGKSMDELGAGGEQVSAEGNPCSIQNDKQDGGVKKKSNGKKEKGSLGKDGSDIPKARKAKKKVSFSGEVEVFPLSADSSSQNNKDWR